MIALRVLHDDKDAEEVLQDVFVQLWQRADRYVSAKGKPLGWMITLTRRRAIDRVRQRTAYRRATERFELICQHHPSAEKNRPAEPDASRADLRNYLERLVQKLPAAQEAIEHAFSADSASGRSPFAAACRWAP